MDVQTTRPPSATLSERFFGPSHTDGSPAGDNVWQAGVIEGLVDPAPSLPATDVPHAIAEALRDTAAPEPDENWTTKLRRSRLAIAHAFASRSSHEQSLASIGATGRKGERT
jgi:hypothetical protein